MDCTIKIIKGPEEGQEFRCAGNETIVGRSPRSQVRLSSQTISYEHAIVSKIGDEFFIENLSANGTFVNDDRISGKVKLRARDRLQFGQETIGRVEAVPGAAMTSQRRLLWIVAGISMMLTVVLLAVAALSPAQAGVNVGRAYPKLEAFVQEQVERKQMPPQSLELMKRAWRLEMSRDRTNSRAVWRDLNILLASREQEAKMEFLQAMYAHPDALSRMASEDNSVASFTPTETQLKAALVQFVVRMAAGRN
ncbi:MAG: FHA domain-containing protein [Phycisphaerales bacterium]|nr:FHA domain-containing protein [Phycisphaerales bacterium]